MGISGVDKMDILKQWQHDVLRDAWHCLQTGQAGLHLTTVASK